MTMYNLQKLFRNVQVCTVMGWVGQRGVVDYLNNSPAVGRGANPPVATGNRDKSGKLAK